MHLDGIVYVGALMVATIHSGNSIFGGAGIQTIAGLGLGLTCRYVCRYLMPVFLANLLIFPYPLPFGDPFVEILIDKLT